MYVKEKGPCDPIVQDSTWGRKLLDSLLCVSRPVVSSGWSTSSWTPSNPVESEEKFLWLIEARPMVPDLLDQAIR